MRLLIILLILTTGLQAQERVAKKYRIRAVQDSIYVQDTISRGRELKVYSPYIMEMKCSLFNSRGYVVAVLSRDQAWVRKDELPGWYYCYVRWVDYNGKSHESLKQVFVE